MSKKVFLIIIILFVVLVGGATAWRYLGDKNMSEKKLAEENIGVENYELPSGFDSLSVKEQLIIIHTNNLQYFLNADIEMFMKAFLKEAIEEKGIAFSEYKKLFEEIFSENKFKQIKGKRVSEVVDLNKIEFMEAGERKLVRDSTYFVCCSGADAFIAFPFKEEYSGIVFAEGGFIASYKKINGQWKLFKIF